MAEIGSHVYNTGATIDNQHLIATQDNGKPVPFHDADVFSKGLRYPARAIASYSSDNAVICDLVGVADLLPLHRQVDIQSVLLFDGQVYEGIFQTATMVFEQIAQKLYDLPRSSGTVWVAELRCSS